MINACNIGPQEKAHNDNADFLQNYFIYKYE